MLKQIFCLSSSMKFAPDCKGCCTSGSQNCSHKILWAESHKCLTCSSYEREREQQAFEKLKNIYIQNWDCIVNQCFPTWQGQTTTSRWGLHLNYLVCQPKSTVTRGKLRPTPGAETGIGSIHLEPCWYSRMQYLPNFWQSNYGWVPCPMAQVSWPWFEPTLGCPQHHT